MTITNLSIKHLNIPFKVSFKHSSAERTVTDSVLVRASSALNTGFGESCPRDYVTHETYSSVVKFFETFEVSIIASITSLSSLKKWVDKNKDAIDNNPAAWCSIELALLDLLAREKYCTIENVLHLPELSKDYSYTAVLGESGINSFKVLLLQYKKMGFLDYKVKLSGDIAHDKAKCDLIREKVYSARIRLDANNLWTNPQDAISYINELGHVFFAIEEPLQPFDFKGLESIYNELNIKVILDESFLNSNQFKYIYNKAHKYIINVRVSKMGGLLRSLDILKEAKKYNIKCIVGAQVGETSILTRAALTLTSTFRDNVIAQEGACGTYLLKEDICSPVLMFEKGGILNQSQLSACERSGWGLIINTIFTK